jgi:serine kinase of HPr protein (carbohydrate metabolism regulator)
MTAGTQQARLHATCVAVDGLGVLLRGPPGSGKSDLALRLIETGAELVADDQTELAGEGADLLAGSPATIAGLLEVRGLGLLRFPCRSRVRVVLAVDLVEAAAVPRLPDPASLVLCGITVPLLALWPHAASAPIKVRLAVRRLHCDKEPYDDRNG